jgi:glycosyltransferase involved in cell wall biosynthesis
MALDHIVALPRAGLMRRKLGIIRRANLARDARQWELAAELYRRALERNPDNPPIWVQYGHALKESGELRDPHSLMQAESAYRKAVSLDHGVADSYLQLGHVLKLQGKVEEARAAYIRALALDSSLDAASFELAQLGWSELHLSELRGILRTDVVGSGGASSVAETPPAKTSDPEQPHTSHFLDCSSSVAELEHRYEATSFQRSVMPAESAVDGQYVGYVDGSIIGWAIDKNCPSIAVQVELVIDGEAICTVSASQFSQDLADQGIGAGYHGFVVTAPRKLWDGQSHRVILRAAGHGHVLNNCPVDVIFGGPHPGASSFLSSTAMLVGRTPAVSVIMPTYNRGALMERSIERYLACDAQGDIELIVIDDGSKDDTPDRLQRLARMYPNLVTNRIANSGPARARNLACSMARGAILLFVGDDVMPVDNDLLGIHLAAHQRFDHPSQAVLGKVSWPNATDLPINFVMAFVQGDGQQQFAYKEMQAYNTYTWNYFYTSNVSVKRSIINDWEREGFDTSFTLAGWEDGEFALRMTKRFQAIGEDFGILYVPAANVVHFHPFTVQSFIRRQISVGMMAARLLELHPEQEIGLGELISRLKTNPDQTNLPIEHYLAIFEGLRSWLIVIENHYGLGSQNWHGDALGAIFHLAYLEGYIRNQVRSEFNYANGCRYILETVRNKFNRAIFTEVIGSMPGFGFV